MKQPRKHAELIKAWADGAEIEWFDGRTWQVVRSPAWCDDTQYRVKPEPKPDVVLIVTWKTAQNRLLWHHL